MNKFFQRLLSIFIPIGIVLVIFFCINLYNVFYVVNTNFDSENIKLYVKPNTNFVELKKQITPFVKSSYYFNIAADQKGYSSRVKREANSATSFGSYETAKGGSCGP